MSTTLDPIIQVPDLTVLADPETFRTAEAVLVDLAKVGFGPVHDRGKPAYNIKAWPYTKTTPEQDKWLWAPGTHHEEWVSDDFQDEFWEMVKRDARELGLSRDVSSAGRQGGWLVYGRDRDEFACAHNDIAEYVQHLRRVTTQGLDLDEALEFGVVAQWEAELAEMLEEHRSVCEEATLWLQLCAETVQPYLDQVPDRAIDFIEFLMEAHPLEEDEDDE